MKVVKWLCSAAACLCCGLLVGVGATLAGAAERHHSVARMLYLTLLLVSMIVAWAMYNLPAWIDNASYLSYIPSFVACDGSNTTVPATAGTKVADWVVQREFGVAALSLPDRLCFGALSAHRVLFATTVFHGALALALFGASSADVGTLRYEIQHGWWAVKAILLAVLAFAAFFALDNAAVRIYSYVALAGALVFVFVQVLLLIEFAYRANGYLRRAYLSGSGRSWRCVAAGALVTAILMCNVLAVTVIGALVVAATTISDCVVGWAAPLILVVLSVLITAISALAYRSERGGLAPAAVVVAYCAYLTWSALAPEALRDAGCRISDGNGNGGGAIAYVLGAIGLHDISQDAQKIVLLGTAFFSMLYGTLRSSAAFSEPATPDDAEAPLTHDDDDDGCDGDGDDTAPPPPPYRFAEFHVLFALGACYAAMVVTGWSPLEGNRPAAIVFINATAASMWVKLASAWATLLLYAWVVIAPLVRTCRGRDSRNIIGSHGEIVAT